MTDFYPMVLAALAKLAHNTQETRQALYERARTTLADRLRGLDPPLPPQRIMEERLAFEEAVRRAEADWQRGLVEHELLSKLADALEHDPLPNDLPRRPGPSWTHLSGALEQSVTGSRFAYREDGRFGFAAGATEAERAAAADPLARSIRAELDYKARELAGRLARIPDPARYRDLLDAVRMFTRALGAPEAGAAPDIGTLWPLELALAAQVDSVDLASSSGPSAPLEADMARALRDLVTASGPWIAMFAGARALDDRTRPPPSEIVDAAAILLRGAAQATLLGEEAAAIVRMILEPSDPSPALAAKIGHWTVATASNLGIALLLTLARIVRGYEGVENAVEPPETARRIERMVIEHEARLLQVFSHLPDGVRSELRTAIDAIRASAEDDV